MEMGDGLSFAEPIAAAEWQSETIGVVTIVVGMCRMPSCCFSFHCCSNIWQDDRGGSVTRYFFQGLYTAFVLCRIIAAKRLCCFILASSYLYLWNRTLNSVDHIQHTTHKELLLTQPSLAHLTLHSSLAADSPPAIGFRAMHL